MDLSMENMMKILESMMSERASLHTQTESASEFCDRCDQTGWIRHFSGDYSSVEKCACRIKAETLVRFRSSGLENLIDSCTFDNFIEKEPWQQAMKETAMRYAQHVKNKGTEWMYMGGAVGSGKSHLCTAVCVELMQEGRYVRYMQWVPESRRLKALVTEEDDFEDAISRYRDVDILYIDDLLKAKHGAGDTLKPTDSDIRIMFEIINDRYNQKKPTIISSEWTLSRELMDVDAGAFSRIYDRAKNYICEVGGKGKNFRMRGENQ